MRIFQPIISGSLTVTGPVTAASFTGSLFGSSSYAFTASYALNAGNINTGSLITTSSFNSYTGSNTSQFAGTASFAQTASYVQVAFTASYATDFTIANTLTVDGGQIKGSSVTSTIVGSNNLVQQATGSYTSAHSRYTLYKGANARAGEFVTVWNGSTATYYDNATTDIGTTSDITLQSAIVTSQLQINAVAASSGWTIKMLTTYL